MTTADFIEAITHEITDDVERRVLEKITPLVKQMVFSNSFNITEAAQYIGCHPDTLRTLCKKNLVPFIYLRNRYAFRQTSLDRWISQQEKANYKPEARSKKSLN